MVLSRPLALFDADCGFCSRCAALIPLLRAEVDVAALQSSDLASLGVDADRAALEMPVVCPAGRVAWGHHAWATILRACPQPVRTLGVLLDARLLEAPASAAYRWVAEHRHLMPGGTPACAVAPVRA